MKDLKELVALNTALKSRFKKERELIEEAKKIVRRILDEKVNSSVLTQAGLRDINDELQTITNMLETQEPFETSVDLAKVVQKTLATAKQLPAPKEQGKQDNSNRPSVYEPPPKSKGNTANPYSSYYNSNDKVYEIRDNDGRMMYIRGDGENRNGVRMLTPAQVEEYGFQRSERGGRKSRRLRRTKF